jgi:Acetyltransferase (GNAT) domain
LAAISPFLRTVRDANGTPQRIGHLFYVATRPDAQRQGHGRELLARTTHAMQQDGCQWAMVSAGAPARGFYAGAGWRLYDTSYRQGSVSADLPDTTTPYRISAYDPMQAPEGWAPLMPIYAAYAVVDQRPADTTIKLVYEDVYFAVAPQREAQIAAIWNMLQLDPLPPEPLQQYLEPEQAKVNSVATYALLPNAQEIHEQCGNDVTGWLYE